MSLRPDATIGQALDLPVCVVKQIQKRCLLLLILSKSNGACDASPLHTQQPKAIQHHQHGGAFVADDRDGQGEAC